MYISLIRYHETPTEIVPEQYSLNIHLLTLIVISSLKVYEESVYVCIFYLRYFSDSISIEKYI